MKPLENWQTTIQVIYAVHEDVMVCCSGEKIEDDCSNKYFMWPCSFGGREDLLLLSGGRKQSTQEK